MKKINSRIYVSKDTYSYVAKNDATLKVACIQGTEQVYVPGESLSKEYSITPSTFDFGEVDYDIASSSITFSGTTHIEYRNGTAKDIVNEISRDIDFGINNITEEVTKNGEGFWHGQKYTWTVKQKAKPQEKVVTATTYNIEVSTIVPTVKWDTITYNYPFTGITILHYSDGTTQETQQSLTQELTFDKNESTTQNVNIERDITWNEIVESVNVTQTKKPSITITTTGGTDISLLTLEYDGNDTLKTPVTWTSDLDDTFVKIEGDNLTFLKHYEGDISLSATAVNASDAKVVPISCGEVATATTYDLGVVEPTPDVEATATTAVINYSVIPTYHYPLKDDIEGDPFSTSHTVTFSANTGTTVITHEGTFVDDYNLTVPYSVKQKEIPSDFVDLDLPSGTQWMRYNIGGENEYDTGKFFQWGDTVGYEGDEAAAHSYWATAPFNNGSSTCDYAYFRTNSGTWLTNKAELKVTYDAAYQATSGAAKMPTKAQLNELLANTTREKATINGVEGVKYISTVNPSKYMFIPCIGTYYEGEHVWEGTFGDIWSNTFDIYTSYTVSLGTVIESGAWYLTTNISSTAKTRPYPQHRGFSIRGVKNTTIILTYSDGTQDSYTDTVMDRSLINTSKTLVKAELKDGVTTIGGYAFQDCTSLTSVTIPDSVTTIDTYAFSNCTNVPSITIPNSVTTIGRNAFYNVLEIVYNGTAEGSPWGAKSVRTE